MNPVLPTEVSKKRKKIMEKEEKNEKPEVYWFNTHLDEFKKETDRAAVILTSSIFEQALQTLIKHFLVPNASSQDSLFDSPNAPLSSFASKIEISYRLGLISSRLARDLHLIRKIRVKFAHNVFGCNFADGSVKSLVEELRKSSSCVCGSAEEKERKLFGGGTRGYFCMVTSWILFAINRKIEEIKNIQQADLEWGYKPFN
jgi:DNA-binding MltR family transcriptional regulator